MRLRAFLAKCTVFAGRRQSVGTPAIEKFWAGDAFARELTMKADLNTDALGQVSDMAPGAFLKGRGLMQGVDVGSGELAGAICARIF